MKKLKISSNKQGDVDIGLGPKQLLYLIIFIVFILIIFGIISLMKKNIF